MNCLTCIHWKIIRTEGSDRGDRQMEAIGYKNCAMDTSNLGAYRFIYGASTSCDKHKEAKA